MTTQISSSQWCRIALILSAIMLIAGSCSDSSTSPNGEIFNPQTPSNCLLMPLPGSTGRTITVSTVAELLDAVQQANTSGNVTIVLEDGTYTLDDMLWISGRKVTFRSRSGNREAVVIQGQGMSGGVSHIFNVPGDNVTVADLTIGWVANHAIQIHSSADAPVIHNVRFVDTGEQMLKVSYVHGESASSDNGVVEWCLFEYSAGIGPQYYIGGIDAHQAHNWIIRNNTFRHIRSPEADVAEHAIHFWSESSNTLVEHNTITNCDRGIGFGLGDRGHRGGMIRNNMVHTSRDVGIGLESASGAEVYHNTVFIENYANAIEYRFPRTQGAAVVNNLTNADIASRDGGSGRIATNVTTAQAAWFANVSTGNLHLVTANPIVIDQGQGLDSVTQDFDCELRPKGNGYDIGADEY